MQLQTFTSEEQAFDFAVKANDYFYIAAYKLQLWIGELNIQANDAYSEQPDPAERQMQTGQAWKSFQPIFAHVKDKAFHHIVGILVRFSRSDNPISTTLFGALAALYLEHEVDGGYLNFEKICLSPPPTQLVPLMRRSVERMCDWVDSVIHANMQSMSFREPDCFDPDPETRFLASRHMSQRYVAQMSDATFVAPYLAPSPSKGRIPGEAGPQQTRKHKAGGDDPHNRLNQAIITIWPVLKLHNWTYADLWTVLRDCSVPTSPCGNHRQLAHYCCHTLGLRKTGAGHRATNSKPAAHALALRLLTQQRSGPAPGSAPWS